MKETDSTEALRANWRRELERRALKIRSIPVAKLLKDLADPEKMLKHERICVELARRTLRCGASVPLKSGKLVRIYESREDGYFYLRRGALPLFADVIDWQGMFSAAPKPQNPPTGEVKPEQEEQRRKQREAARRWRARQDPKELRRKQHEKYCRWKERHDPEELRRKQHEKYCRWKERHDPEEQHRYWREAMRRWRAKEKSAASAGK